MGARVLVTAAGYQGDVLPFVSVSRELVSRGHHVDLVVPSGFHQALADEPVQLHALGVEFSPRELFGVHRPAWEHAGTRLGAARMTRTMVRVGMLDHLDSIYESLAGPGADADLVLMHNVIVPARWVAELRGIPRMNLNVIPSLVPRTDRVPGLRPMPRTPRGLNVVAWKGALAVMDRVFAGDTLLNGKRRALGLPAERHHLLATMLAPNGVILPVSPQWFPRSPDWPDRIVTPGFVPWEPPDAPLHPEVSAYLDAGDAPVLVTLGTSAATNAGEVFDRIAEGLDQLGVRGMFLVGDQSNITGALRDRGGVWPFAPLHQVLPRCRAVVHSSSLGTMAAVLRAGLPSLAVPLLMDQIWNAHRTAQLGAGLVVRNPTPRRVLRLLQQLITDQALTERAKDFSARLATENGASRAADAIEAVLTSEPGSTDL
jgi:UDP:flavonoid glycosyltransferase YjiC (YdhE family)